MSNPYANPYNDPAHGFPQPLPSYPQATAYEQTNQTGFDMTKIPPLPPTPQPVAQSASLLGAQTAQDVDLESTRTWVRSNFGGRMADAEILANLLDLCHNTRQCYSDAIASFEMHNQIFLSGRSPMSKEDRDQYLRAYDSALMAARGLFGPQEVYRDALARLTLFTSDLIDSMPTKMCKDRRILKSEFEMSMGTAKDKEEVVREMMRQLHSGIGGMERSVSLVNYVRTMTRRLKNWQEDEEVVEKYAKASLGALL